MNPHANPFTQICQALIAVVLLCISPVVSQSSEAEEYADEQWTLSRIFHCPDRAMPSEFPLSFACSHEGDSDFNARSRPDNENALAPISVLSDWPQPAT
ncbi:MAG: hypothetical protein Q9M25_07080, partial [Mariprofundaceae bacterium]|nr:hypothetical protein [Mariprofundaceae bacterium]